MQDQHIFTTEDHLPMHYMQGHGPWGDQGVTLKDAPTSAEAIKQAGLGWGVELKPAGFMHNGAFIENPSKKMVVRSDNNQALSVVGNVWEPLQNKDAFTFFDPFVEAGLCEYHTAGYISNGERIFVLAKIKADPVEVLKGDPVDSFFLLTNVHSGASCGRVIFTNIRFYCTNVLPAMLRETKQQKIFHKGDVLNSISQVQEVIDLRQRDFAATMEQFKFLASKQIKGMEVDTYLDRVLSDDKIKIVNGEMKTDKDQSTYRNTKNRIVELMETGMGTNIKGVKGSFWGAYNGVTEFFTHHKGREVNNRVKAIFYGKSKEKSKMALSVALDMAQAA